MTLQQKINRETMKLNLNWCNLLSDQLLLKTPYHTTWLPVTEQQTGLMP